MNMREQLLAMGMDEATVDALQANPAMGFLVTPEEAATARAAQGGGSDAEA